MNRFFISTTWLWMLISFFACEFSTDEVYFRELEKNTEAPIITNLNLDLEKDTIHIFVGRYNFMYNFKSDNQEIQGVRILINGEEHTVNDNANGSFRIDHSDVNLGQNKLTVELYVTSGTGSIAEALGAESFQFTKDIVLIYNGNYDELMTTSTKNGYLHLQWLNYPVNSPDFISYQVYRKLSNGKEILLTETQARSYTDKSYVGEGGKYYVYIQKIGGEKQLWAKTEMEKSIPTFSNQAINDSTQLIFWKRGDFFNAIGEYHLVYQMFGEFSDTKKVVSSEDTSLIIGGLYYGDALEIEMYTVPKEHSPQYFASDYNFVKRKYIYVWDSFWIPNSMIGDAWAKAGQDEIVFASQRDTLYRYNLTEKRFKQRLRPNSGVIGGIMRFSPNGKYFTANLPYANERIIFDSMDFNKFAHRNFDIYTTSRYSPILVSDDGLVLIPRLGDGYVLYNMWQNKAVGSGHHKDGLKMSKGAKYLWVRGDKLMLVKRTNSNNYTELYRSDEQYSRNCWFNTVDTNSVIIQTELGISRYQLEPFVLQRNINIGEDVVLDINFYKNQVLTFREGWLRITSLDNGNLVDRVHVPNSYEEKWNRSKTILLDDMIIRYPNHVFHLN